MLGFNDFHGQLSSGRRVNNRPVGGAAVLASYLKSAAASARNGAIVDIVKQLDDEIDIVVSGHAHSFTNTLLENNNGKKILVTQAFSSSTAFADIDVAIDSATCDIVEKSAMIVTTYADAGPGLAPLVNQLVAYAPND